MKRHTTRLHRRRGFTLAILVALLFLAVLYSATAGQLHTTFSEVIGSVLHSMTITWIDKPSDPTVQAALWYVRFPRIVVGLLIGAGLAMSGVLLQGVFSNPLAEPGIIGVSAGSAVGAAGAIALGSTGFAAIPGLSFLISANGHSQTWVVTICAFVTGIATTTFIYLASRSSGRSEIVTLILIGIAVNAVAGGIISFLTFIADSAARDQIVFWQMGSLAGSSWTAAAWITAITLPALCVAWLLGKQLDLMSLGEIQAGHLGINVERLRVAVIVTVSVVVAVGVSFTGIISFIGLVVPHALRLIVGPSHRFLIISSALGGALTLTVADVMARTVVSGADLPIGMLTSLVGGPVFFYLLRYTHRRAQAWR